MRPSANLSDIAADIADGSIVGSVACVIPCYNCADTIVRCVRSVQAQTRRPSQIILVDDCSADDTRDLIDALAAEDPSIVALRMAQNGGPSRARNAGWDRANSGFVAFLDADDTWHPQKIELQLRLFQDRPELTIIGHLAAVDGDLGTADHHMLSDSDLAALMRPIHRNSVLTKNPWSTPTVMLRRDCPFRFDEDQREAEDYLMWAQILLSGHAGMRLELPLAVLYKARYGAGGLSGNLWKMEKGELRTFGKLWRRGHIGPLEYMLSSLLSLAKYLRRVFWPA